MPTHAPHRPSNFVSWLLVSCLSACVGTPTPEPPDTLPRPKETLIFGTPIEIDLAAVPLSAVPVPVRGRAGAVPPNSELWIVNLDSADDGVTVFADAEGRFRAEIMGLPNDRVRLFARTDQRHSPPLDAEVASVGAGMFILAQGPSTDLACLDIEPSEVTAVVSADVTRHFTLTSHCDGPVQIERAQLRFGEGGFSIEAPMSVPANGKAEVSVHIAGHDEPRAKADILLLDVSLGARTGRYALSMWSVAASSIGNDR